MLIYIFSVTTTEVRVFFVCITFVSCQILDVKQILYSHLILIIPIIYISIKLKNKYKQNYKFQSDIIIATPFVR